VGGARVARRPPGACAGRAREPRDDRGPEAKSGKEGTSDDIERRAGCSWSSLDNNGVKGSQFRWLNVSLLRFESDVARGAGDELAKKYYDKQVGDAQSAEGAKGTESEPVKGAGEIGRAH